MMVRPALAADAEALFELIRATPGLPRWSRDAFWPEQNEEDSTCAQSRRRWVAEENDQMVGFAQLAVVLDEAELEGIAVKAGEQRRGIGRLLLAHVIEAARGLGAARFLLEVRRSNGAAIALYRSSGLRVTGSRRGYYSDPVEDSLLLELSLHEVS